MIKEQLRCGFSLKAQLYSLVIGIMIIAFVGSLWISISTTRSYFNQQMQSHAQDTATSLGLSISPYMDGKNTVMVETMIASIFDSGYYQSLILTDVNDNILISHHNEVLTNAVPQWFIQLFPLTPPLQSTTINNGWKLAGTLSLKSHPGISYQKLWQHSLNHFYSSLVICLIALIVVYFILGTVLEPLTNIETQARAVCKKQFPLITNLPITRELKIVITAMNTMVSNIHSTFDQMSKRAEKLNKDVFIDQLTNLGNRRAFESQFPVNQEEMNQHESATLGMVQLPSLQNINTEFGFQPGDEYVCLAAQIIKNKLQSHNGSKLYRVSGSNFFFTLKEVSTDIITMCEELHHKFSSLNSHRYPDGFAQIIATSFKKKDRLTPLLSKLDTLITQEYCSDIVHCRLLWIVKS